MLYQQRYILLSNLGEVKLEVWSDDKAEQQLNLQPRIPPAQRCWNALALCLLIAICTIFIFLLKTFISYAGTTPLLPSRPDINSSTIVTRSFEKSTTGHEIMPIMQSTIVVSSSGIVGSRISVNPSTSLMPTSAADEAAIQSTAVGMAKTRLQSTRTFKVQGSKSTFSTLTSCVLTSAIVLPVLTTPTSSSIDHDVLSCGTK